MADGNGRDLESHDTVRHVVLVVLDTARAVSVGPETTPTLTALAQEGTELPNAFATAPWTLPSHASMFTGMYPSEHGAHGGHPLLASGLRTLPEAFRDAGYETIAVSNNTWITEEFGFDRGFDELRKGWQYIQADADMGAVVRGEDLREKLQATRRRLFDGNPLVNATNILYSEFLQPAGDDGVARSTEWVADWLENRPDDQPLFLFCNFIEPHVTYDPPRSYAEQFLPDEESYAEATAIRQDPRAYDCNDYTLTEREFALLRGLYRAELAYVDDNLATLCQALEDAGIWDETLLVVCGDHGEHIGEHDFFGHQYNLYDTVLQVPLVFHGGPFTGGGRRDDLVQLLDLPTTLLETAGVTDRAFQQQSVGHSILPDSEERRSAIFAEYVSPQPSIERLEARFGTLPEHVYTYDRRLQAVRTREYKYVRGDDGSERLHDLDADPGETVDIATNEPAIADRFRARLETQFGPMADSETTDPVQMREGTKERLADLGYL